MITKPIAATTANQILAVWLKAHDKSIAQLCRDCGYISGYPYQLLLRHPRPITYEVIGRLLVIYGLDGPAVAMAKAMRQARAGGNDHSP
jgi:hypothetical protein